MLFFFFFGASAVLLFFSAFAWVGSGRPRWYSNRTHRWRCAILHGEVVAAEKKKEGTHRAARYFESTAHPSLSLSLSFLIIVGSSTPCLCKMYRLVTAFDVMASPSAPDNSGALLSEIDSIVDSILLSHRGGQPTPAAASPQSSAGGRTSPTQGETPNYRTGCSRAGGEGERQQGHHRLQTGEPRTRAADEGNGHARRLNWHDGLGNRKQADDDDDIEGMVDKMLSRHQYDGDIPARSSAISSSVAVTAAPVSSRTAQTPAHRTKPPHCPSSPRSSSAARAAAVVRRLEVWAERRDAKRLFAIYETLEREREVCTFAPQTHSMLLEAEQLLLQQQDEDDKKEGIAPLEASVSGAEAFITRLRRQRQKLDHRKAVEEQQRLHFYDSTTFDRSRTVPSPFVLSDQRPRHGAVSSFGVTGAENTFQSIAPLLRSELLFSNRMGSQLKSSTVSMQRDDGVVDGVRGELSRTAAMNEMTRDGPKLSISGHYHPSSSHRS